MTFYYNSPNDNSFWGVATGGQSDGVPADQQYNCMAYALGITNQWVWPWNGYPTDQQLITEMKNRGYNTSSATVMPGTEIIYYSGGHFSEVVEWDMDGMPTTIYSKWGSAELIESADYDPFTNAVYKEAHYFFKK